LLVDLEAEGVEVLVVTPSQHAKACGEFYDAVVEHSLRHLDQAEVNLAVVGADRKFYGDAWYWARRQSQSDITPLIAATLAVWAASQAVEPAMALPEAILL
jgi:hypothetical protein